MDVTEHRCFQVPSGCVGIQGEQGDEKGACCDGLVGDNGGQHQGGAMEGAEVYGS